jgi:hypothetical protein
MQFFPNFTQASPRTGDPAPIQTASAQGTTGSGTGQLVTITWDTPFADTNYVVAFGIEIPTVNAQANASIAGYSKTASAVQVWVVNSQAGTPYTVTAIGFHL